MTPRPAPEPAEAPVPELPAATPPDPVPPDPDLADPASDLEPPAPVPPLFGESSPAAGCVDSTVRNCWSARARSAFASRSISPRSSRGTSASLRLRRARTRLIVAVSLTPSTMRNSDAALFASVSSGESTGSPTSCATARIGRGTGAPAATAAAPDPITMPAAAAATTNGRAQARMAGTRAVTRSWHRSSIMRCNAASSPGLGSTGGGRSATPRASNSSSDVRVTPAPSIVVATVRALGTGPCGSRRDVCRGRPRPPRSSVPPPRAAPALPGRRG